jgi:hypothetical protein
MWEPRPNLFLLKVICYIRGCLTASNSSQREEGFFKKEPAEEVFAKNTPGEEPIDRILPGAVRSTLP